MSGGAFYGIGVGPGDSELITVKGARLIGETKYLFVPIAKVKADSVAFDIVKPYISAGTHVTELVFPMVTDKSELEKRWNESAEKIVDIIRTGEDACFVTLGDPLLYSTYIYLLRAVKRIEPDIKVVTIPGVTAICAVAALTGFPVGERKELVTIVPASDDLDVLRDAILRGGSIALMKVGKRLQQVLELLDELDVIDNSVFVAHAGMNNQMVETDLKKLFGKSAKTGYLSSILIHTGAQSS